MKGCPPAGHTAGTAVKVEFTVYNMCCAVWTRCMQCGALEICCTSRHAGTCRLQFEAQQHLCGPYIGFVGVAFGPLQALHKVIICWLLIKYFTPVLGGACITLSSASTFGCARRLLHCLNDVL